MGYVMRVCTAIVVASLFSISARADPGPEGVELLTAEGLPAGTIQEQLDRDSSLVPFGKGAIFVAAMTNPLDEPPVAVWQGKKKVAENTTGVRIVLKPGTYEVRVGSGAFDQRLKVQATVKELHTTVIPVSWAGLAVHVVDEQVGSLRGSYELIRVEDREYMGIGFGTDEQAGEPLTTWILRPGLYKIVRVGENYRARRDFATVRLLQGKLTHFLLVMNQETGEFVGGGEVPEEELFRPTEGFFGSLVLGADFALNSRTNVPGFADGLSFTLRAFLDGRISFEILDSPLILHLQIEQGQTKSPDLPWQKSSDRVDVDALYVYQIYKWLGPYLRLGAETNLLSGVQLFEEEKEVIKLAAGETRVEIGRELNVDQFRLSSPAGLSILKEGVGMNVRLFKTLFAETTLRTGIGARHRITRDLFELVNDLEDNPLEYREVESAHQVGVEATVLAVARITRWVVGNLEFDSLVPFDDASQYVIEMEASIAVKLTTYFTINYRIRYLRDPALSDEDRLEQDILLRFSLEII